MKFDKNFKKFGWKSKLFLHKFYFDKGFSTASYLKYVIVLFGLMDMIKNENIKLMVWLGIIYSVFCYILGILWVKHFVFAENELQNQFNLFQIQMRERIK